MTVAADQRCCSQIWVVAEVVAEIAAEIAVEVLVELAGGTELVQTELVRAELVQTELVAELEARAEIRQLEELEILLVAVRYQNSLES